MFALPCLVYLGAFIALTWPTILQFNTHFFCDNGDGLQNVWNLWWVNEAVTGLHHSPMHTTMLHHPDGISLLGHTLNPFNGFLAIPLLRFFSLTQTYNLIVIFTFVAGGWSAFLLCHHFARSFVPSLIGGFIFSFSTYHFGHAQGHMQVISIEGIPLFLLFWIWFLESPRPHYALAAALTLFGVMLCDFYHALYCVAAGFILLAHHSFRERNALLILSPRYRFSTLLFIVVCLLTCGTLAVNLLLLNRRDPLWGAHEAWQFSNDLFAIFIPGARWRFGALTEFYWSRLRGNEVENSVYLGWSVIVGVIAAVCIRKRLANFSVTPWLVIIAFFFALSLGPRLLVAGWELKNVPLAYSVASKIFPPLQLGGMPVRMTIMLNLAAAVLFAMAWRELRASGGRPKTFAFALLPLLLIEYLPSPLFTTRIEPPAHVLWMRDHADLEAGESVYDVSHLPSVALYYQTIHKKPMVAGYVARYPGSVFARYQEIERLIRASSLTDLHARFGLRYLALPEDRRPLTGPRLVFEDTTSETAVYDLRPSAP